MEGRTVVLEVAAVRIEHVRLSKAFELTLSLGAEISSIPDDREGRVGWFVPGGNAEEVYGRCTCRAVHSVVIVEG